MENQVPRWLTWAGIVFLVWNLFGVLMFALQWNMTTGDIAQMPPEQQEMWSGMGPVTWGAYAVAILSGTIGAVFLLMKNKGASRVFLIGIAALVVQFSHPIRFALEADHLYMIAFPLFIIAVAVLEFVLARKWQHSGWLK